MTIQGFVRLRFNQLAKQSVIGTAIAATRRVPWRGPLTYNPNRTEPDVDVGSLDPVMRPYAMAVDVGWNPSGPMTFNDLPIRLSAGLKGGVTASSSTWTYQVASLTADAFDYYTVEHGDDTEATDTIIGFGGVADTLEETMPEDGSPWTISDTWIFAGATLGSNGTNSLVVDPAPVFAFGTDTAFYKDTAAGSIGSTQLVDAVHGATIRVSNNLDRKRFANGSNTRFQLAGFGRGARQIEFILTVAKTAATIAEANTLDDTPVPDRYFKVSTTSTEGTNTYERYIPCRLFSRAEGEIGGNATIVLTYRAFYDATLTYAYKAIVVDTLATLP